MKIILIGHRGIGKTTFLFELQKTTKIKCFDLDVEITKMYKASISEIFELHGEAVFREYEKACLDFLVQNNEHFIIALGAGYQGSYPLSCVVIWLRRVSEKFPRVFFDRPRIYPDRTPHEEYEMIYGQRQQRFKQHAHFQYFLEEGGFNTPSLLSPQKLSGVLTSLENTNLDSLSLFFEPTCIEYRDDLAFKKDSLNTLKLYSYRQSEPIDSHPFEDFGLELGVPSRHYTIISKHERLASQSLTDFFDELESYSHLSKQLKAAPMIDSFEELYEGHLWQQKAPHSRSFLPRSSDGKWKWYRLFMKDKMPLNFYRIDGEHNLDQPLLHEWISAPVCDLFGAVLGFPVFHSYSPTFHQKFFARYQMAFYAIAIQSSERDLALKILAQIGMKCAAITAPLKEEGINTLYVSQDGTHKTLNTDLIALKECLKKYHFFEPIAIWGNGEMAQNIKKIYPDAFIYSARQGAKDLGNAKTLIWACGNHSEYKFPESSYELSTLFDLSYIPWSMGKDFAFNHGLKYISGEELFILQAQEQQKFWQSCIEKNTRGK